MDRAIGLVDTKYKKLGKIGEKLLLVLGLAHINFPLCYLPKTAWGVENAPSTSVPTALHTLTFPMLQKSNAHGFFSTTLHKQGVP